MHKFSSANLISEEVINRVADALIEHGYVVVNRFLPSAEAQALLQEIVSLPDAVFKPAAIGRDSLQQLNMEVRSNTLHWLDGRSLAQQQYWKAMEELRNGINRRLFMGLFDFESHYSHYAPGDFYMRHVDAFKGASNRVLSTVLYLNMNWSSQDEGELILYGDETQNILQTVQPCFNDCVIFLSDRFPHEVRPTQKDRYSIAGWFRVNGSLAGQLDPPH